MICLRLQTVRSLAGGQLVLGHRERVEGACGLCSGLRASQASTAVRNSGRKRRKRNPESVLGLGLYAPFGPVDAVGFARRSWSNAAPSSRTCPRQ